MGLINASISNYYFDKVDEFPGRQATERDVQKTVIDMVQNGMEKAKRGSKK